MVAIDEELVPTATAVGTALNYVKKKMLHYISY